MHGYYRNHLVNAFFISRPENEDPETEETSTKPGSPDRTAPDPLPAKPSVHPKFLLTELCPEGSAAPYLLVNATLNLQGVEDPSLRDRQSDIMFFSKYFYGSERVGFARTELLQAAHPKMTLGTAMAVSGAAVSPNMGRRTNGFLVMIMTLLNIRLGYWIPKPRTFEAPDASGKRATWTASIDAVLQMEARHAVLPRRKAMYGVEETGHTQRDDSETEVLDDLFGLALSGGGIRSASFAIGVIQKLEDLGVFRHVDYLSTVSGGGYTGCGISVSLAKEYQRWAKDKNCKIHATESSEPIPEINAKAVRPRRLSVLYYGRELISDIHDRKDWVNVSDGGHSENLAAFELLRRKCRLIIISDAEADPDYRFDGLATLIRLAKLELQADIVINVDKIRPGKDVKKPDDTIEWEPDPESEQSKSQFAVGKIHYNDGTEGKLIYLKSSLTGDEDLALKEYRSRNAAFPHQITLDQLFEKDQFDSYRVLGAHVANQAIESFLDSSEMKPNVLHSCSDFRKSVLLTPSHDSESAPS